VNYEKIDALGHLWWLGLEREGKVRGILFENDHLMEGSMANPLGKM